MVYCEETASDVFLSESAWNILTGDDLDLEPGTAATVYDRNGDSSGAGNSISLVTNHLTGEQLAVTPAEPLRSTSLLGYRVLDDGDYARITQGLPDEWREVVAVFDVEDEEDTYFFARALFDEIVDRSGPRGGPLRRLGPGGPGPLSGREGLLLPGPGPSGTQWIFSH